MTRRCACLVLFAAWALTGHTGLLTDADKSLLKRAREWVEASSGSLPAFTCQEVITRYRKLATPGGWSVRDSVTVDVTVSSQGENYRNVRVDGKASSMSVDEIGGMTSSGEFALHLTNLFGSTADSDFQLSKAEDIKHAGVRVFRFAVNQASSNWRVAEHWEADRHSLDQAVAYSGELWVNDRSQVERLAMNAQTGSFGDESVNVVIRYGPVTINGNVYYLPNHSQVMFCKGSAEICDRNEIAFRDYRQFSVESTLAFATPPPIAYARAATESGGSSSVDAPSLSFQGMVTSLQASHFLLALQDERYISMRMTPGTGARLKNGDWVEVASTQFDGASLVADKIRTVEPNREMLEREYAEQRTARDATYASTQDAIVKRARETGDSTLQSLPNLLCSENVKRYRSLPGHEKWQLEDGLSAEVLFSRKKGESYREIRVNGKPTTKSWMELGGDISTGEFGSMLAGLLMTRGAEFHFVKDERVRGTWAHEYAFRVSRANSDWTIAVDYQMIKAAYSGKVWFDRTSANVLRMERVAEDIPPAFPLNEIRSKVTFGRATLQSAGDRLVPMRAETELQVRATGLRSLKTIEFTKYRLFTEESKIHF